jgi:uncharacterized protein YkwD
MKLTKLLIAILISANCYSQNPLSLWDKIWDDRSFNEYNTAKNANYMSQREKDVIWVINCMRSCPGLFLQTVAIKWDYPKRFTTYKNTKDYKVLIDFLNKLKPMSVLLPDSSLYKSAMTRAEEYPSHKGHYRTTQRGKNNDCDCSEVISYNSFESVDIVMDLLIDIGNPDYGHREILTNIFYSKAGVAIRKSDPGFYISIINLK